MSTADWLMVGAAIAAGGFIIAHFLRKRPASARKALSAPPAPLGGSAAAGAAYGLQSAAAAQRPAPWPERKSVVRPIRLADTTSDNDGGIGIVETVVAASIISDISDIGSTSDSFSSDSFSGGGGDFGGGGASGSWE